MRRREFLTSTAMGVGSVWIGSKVFGKVPIPETLPQRFSASDTVTLGSTGIRTSRLAMGTGTIGGGHHSNQTRLGMKGLTDLFLNGYDHGLRFFDCADSYGSHPYVKEALKRIPREKVTILTKSDNRSPEGMRADIDRFRRELGVDQIDVLLMHCMLEDDWTERYAAVRDVISEAKEKGIVRAHGCSCHTIGALRAAAKSPWVEVDLARMNPVQSHMDADPRTVLGVLKEMKASGKGVIGMKILGQGDMRHRQDDALKFALSLGVLDAFTIGAESIAEQDDLARRISAVSA